jgi:predicted DNA-binding WGR domain protein
MGNKPGYFTAWLGYRPRCAGKDKSVKPNEIPVCALPNKCLGQARIAVNMWDLWIDIFPSDTLSVFSTATMTSCIFQRWEKDTRYYEVRVHQDLWKNWVVTRAWGQRGSKRGRMIHTPCTSYTDALDNLRKIEKKRQSHQYNQLILQIKPA